MSGLQRTLQQLERINELCGGTARLGLDVSVADANAMTSYNKGQHRIACLVKRARDNIGLIAEAGGTMNIARRAEVSNSVRRDISTMKKECANLKRVAMREGKRTEYEQLMLHVRKTEQMQRALYGRQVLGDTLDSLAVESHSSRSGFSVGDPMPTSESMGAQGPMPREGAASLLSPYDIEEFAVFFEQTRKKDSEIDQAINRIGVNVSRLHDNALTLHSELSMQQRLLDETELKVDSVHSKLNSMNERLRKTLKELERDRMGMYMFCCLLLTSVLGALYTASK
ncbi:hypothetical protein ERJ75_000256400 [Trypanosoma vivax]|uniref:t-SNARE coiled-coil homology domain-containing protein n=1 Tax=Trypanosoma vivax (strain Y486) TaxID=1055687 RepID=G0U203_TRYVY|nr:hypothetical protein TRVL_04749 [Trypanosoma vivax]KAH8618695.1 hypothetical protein ERJ75_000256400 [Trypanosoma vivax]CCC50305.1 conserved hypothetical protein [Trypanosoma vivax Y486]